MIDQHIIDLEDLQANYTSRASDILNAEQLRIFKESQASQLAMEKMGLKVAASIMGEPKK